MSVLTIGYSGIGFAMPFYFQSIENLSPQLTGILIAPISISLAVSSVAVGKLFVRMRRPADLVLIGTGICAAGMISLGLAVGMELSVPLIAALLFLIGVGEGLYWVPMVTHAMKLPRRDLLGSASGTWSMFVNLANRGFSKLPTKRKESAKKISMDQIARNLGRPGTTYREHLRKGEMKVLRAVHHISSYLELVH